MLAAAVSLCYRAAGFTLESEITFSQLCADPTVAEGTADILIRIGEPPFGRRGLAMRVRNFGFTALDGSRVIVSIWGRPDPEGVRRLVATGGLNAIAYQRGLLPLHASAVAMDERCFAFCGEVGTGKSTLAAALAQAGYPLICDDLAIVRPGDDGAQLLWPVSPRPKLTRHSISMLRAPVTELTPFADWDGKAVTEVGKTAIDAPRRLAALYLLDWGEPALQRISPLEAIPLLGSCLRKPDWLEQAGSAKSLRQTWLDLVAHVPILRIAQRRDSSAPAALAQALIESWKRSRIDDRPSFSDLRRSHDRHRA